MKTIAINGDDMSQMDSNAIAEIIFDTLDAKGINYAGFSWSIELNVMEVENEPTSDVS